MNLFIHKRSYEESYTRMQKLLEKMTLKEKVGQLYQAPYFSKVVTGHAMDTSETLDHIKSGRVGSVLSVYDENTLYHLQRAATEESRLNIPLLFCFDVIHGFKTAFPINLALSTSWDPLLIETIAQTVAYETTHGGIHLVFSPMVDIVRDPRWGRVMESNGEDPYLSSELTKAYVRGYQGEHLANKHSVAACVKHFAGYGFVEAGREYNTVDISKRVLFNTVLPPFKAAIHENVAMLMTSFNTLFDIPATANPYLLKDILRDDLQFKGITISDYTSTEEIIAHKIAKDLKHVAELCFNAGLDHEMVSKSYHTHLETLVHENKVKEKDLNEAVLRMLVLKDQLGLFDDPYRNIYTNSSQYMLLKESRLLALKAAIESIVLLKNDTILPLNENQNVALIGPFSDNQDTIGEWPGLTNKEDVITLKKALENDKVVHYTNLPKDLNELKDFDAIILTLGEASMESGEGHSKTSIEVDPNQKALFDTLYSVNPNIIVIFFAGRPLILSHFDYYAKAILYAFQPGTMTGTALRNLLYGYKSPSAKLTMTFPKHQGQIPIYYNHYKTGRPFDLSNPDYRYNTRYIDCDNEPLYPFGYGLSYANIQYGNLDISSHSLKANDEVNVSITLKNPSHFTQYEIVQCYIEVLTYSVSRPVNELKKFKKIKLLPKTEKTIQFSLNIEDFRSYNKDMIFTAEEQSYLIKVGPNSQTLQVQKIDVFDHQ